MAATSVNFDFTDRIGLYMSYGPPDHKNAYILDVGDTKIFFPKSIGDEILALVTASRNPVTSEECKILEFRINQVLQHASATQSFEREVRAILERKGNQKVILLVCIFIIR